MRIPAELAFMIIKTAAWQEIAHHRGFVADLCRICRSIHSLITPILYNTIRLDNSIKARAMHGSSHDFAQHTRYLLIPDFGFLDSYYDNRCMFQTVRSGFSTTEFLLRCSISLDLIYCDGGGLHGIPRPIALFVPGDSWNSYSKDRRDISKEALSSVTHLAMSNLKAIAFIQPYDGMKLTYILLEISPQYCREPQGLDIILVLLGVPKLQRLVFPCARGTEVERASIKEILRTLAEARREARIAFIDTSPAGLPAAGKLKASEIFERDVVDRYGVWYTGTTLYGEA